MDGVFECYKSLAEVSELEYYHDVSLYENAPRTWKHVHECLQMSTARTELYKILIEASIKFKKYSDGWTKFVIGMIEEKNLHHFSNMLNKPKIKYEIKKVSREFDYIGHYLLCLAYCKKETNIFLKCEIDWLFLRASVTPVEGIVKFLNNKGLRYKLLPAEEKIRLHRELLATYNLQHLKLENVNFYKVHFSDIAKLLKHKQVFLKNGVAVIPEISLPYFLISVAKKSWQGMLERSEKFLRSYCEVRTDNLLRNVPILKENVFLSTTTYICSDNLEEHVRLYFPLCMQNIHEHLKKMHHLKHGARMQYGIFLKYTGLPYEDAMEFWEMEFTKKFTPYEFRTKKYKYWFQHQYGKVGGKIDQPPYTCGKIMSNTPLPGQIHGCPFKHFDEERLKQTLRKKNISDTGIGEIIASKKNGDFREACSRYCEFSNGRPMQYFKRPDEYYHTIKDIEDLFAD